MCVYEEIFTLKTHQLCVWFIVNFEDSLSCCALFCSTSGHHESFMMGEIDLYCKVVTYQLCIFAVRKHRELTKLIDLIGSQERTGIWDSVRSCEPIMSLEPLTLLILLTVPEVSITLFLWIVYITHTSYKQVQQSSNQFHICLIGRIIKIKTQ